MDIYEMLEKGMTADEIKAEVDKTAALYKEDQESEKEENYNFAKEDLHDSMINFLDATGEVDPEILKSEAFDKSVYDIIDDFREQLNLYSKLSKAIKSKDKKIPASPDDLQMLARMFF